MQNEYSGFIEITKSIASVVGPIISFLGLLIVAFWKRKVKESDDKAANDEKERDRLKKDVDDRLRYEEKEREKIKKEIQEWAQLRDVYHADTVKEIKHSITDLYTRANSTEKQLDKLSGKVDSNERVCDERHSR